MYETDALATQFREAGYEILEPDVGADVHVINSCTITNRADRKSRNHFNRANRSGSRLVVLTGCFVNSHRDQMESSGSTLVVPNEQKHALLEIVEAHQRDEIVHPQGSVFDFPTPGRVFHTRTLIKVQDGCDNHCAFCIIPQVRGRAVSRPADEVVRSAREAIAAGAKELVLTGVNMSRYRNEGAGFADLVSTVLELPGDFRVRISSLEPDCLGTSFAELFRHPKMCPHLHLCLQSGSDRVLRLMRRQYTFSEYMDLAQQLRVARDGFNITTDVLVGFPGETEEDFQASLDAVKRLGFGHVHTFPYSERGGTQAARMPNAVPNAVRTGRAAKVRTVADEVKTGFRTRCIGKTMRLLVETVAGFAPEEDRTAHGFGENYVPIELKLSPDMHVRENEFVDVEITGIKDDTDPRLTAVLA